ncbi:hypothetical protein [Nostoc commune]|uniref:hypothetical protein n=1 Tax=Nostoc commune TaxID=1178 RepID=UPI002072E577|nr:hypothetical protein [Nostoc commune]
MISQYNKLHINELALASFFRLLAAAFELCCLRPSLLVLRSHLIPFDWEPDSIEISATLLILGQFLRLYSDAVVT